MQVLSEGVCLLSTQSRATAESSLKKDESAASPSQLPAMCPWAHSRRCQCIWPGQGGEQFHPGRGPVRVMRTVAVITLETFDGPDLHAISMCGLRRRECRCLWGRSTSREALDAVLAQRTPTPSSTTVSTVMAPRSLRGGDLYTPGTKGRSVGQGSDVAIRLPPRHSQTELRAQLHASEVRTGSQIAYREYTFV